MAFLSGKRDKVWYFYKRGVSRHSNKKLIPIGISLTIIPKIDRTKIPHLYSPLKLKIH